MVCVFLSHAFFGGDRFGVAGFGSLPVENGTPLPGRIFVLPPVRNGFFAVENRKPGGVPKVRGEKRKQKCRLPQRKKMNPEPAR